MKPLQIFSNHAYPMVNHSTIFTNLDFGSQFLSNSIEELETQYKLQPTKENREILIYRIDKEIVDSHASLKAAQLRQQEAQQALATPASSSYAAVRLYQWITDNLLYYLNASPDQLVEYYGQQTEFYESKFNFLSRYKEQLVIEKNFSEYHQQRREKETKTGNITYPGFFDLSCINGSSGVIINEASAPPIPPCITHHFYSCGEGLVNIGDINADGIDDLAGMCDGSIIFVYYGEPEFGNKSFSGFKINILAAPYSSCLRSISGSDINDDGIADLIIGNTCGGINYYGDSVAYSGSVYVLFGKSNLERDIINCNLPFLNGKNGFVINGTTSLNETIGVSVASLGDVNADGLNDFAIGTWITYTLPRNKTYSYVIFGGKTLGQEGYIILSLLNGITGFKFYCNNSNSYMLSRAGDINADGVKDILILNPENNYLYNTYAVFGNKNLGNTGLIDLSQLNGINGFKINDAGYYGFGHIGDINADGKDDFAIGNNPNTAIFFGTEKIGNKGTVSIYDLNGANGFIINGSLGEPYYDYIFPPTFFNYIGDFNQDGIDDLLVGCGDWTTYYYGECLIFGNPLIGQKGYFELNYLNGHDGIFFNINSLSISCGSISGADINADGFPDILIGLPYYNGIISIIFGGRQLVPCKDNIYWLIPFLSSVGGIALIALSYGLYKYKKRKRILISDNSPLLNDKETKYDHFPKADSIWEPEQTEGKPVTLTTVVINPSVNSNRKSSVEEFKVLLNRNPRKKYCLCFSCCYKKPLEEPFIRYSELKYDKKSSLAKTNTSIIYAGVYQKQPVAIKRIKNSNLDKNSFEELTTEAKILSAHKSEYIVELIGVAKESKHTFIAMELMTRGSLYNLLKNSSNLLPLPKIIIIALDICHGVLHLHANNIIHRDLKSKNILLNDNLRAKIGDLGSAKIKNNLLETKTVDHKGLTIFWAAPELFQGQKSSKSSDIYAMCMIFWELIIRPYKHPFQGITTEYELHTVKLERKDDQETIPEDSKLCPPAFAKIIRSGWRKASQRPSAELIAKELEKLRQEIELNQPISLDSAGGNKPAIDVPRSR